MVFSPSGLIPARFLSLISHLVITILLLWSRDENVKSSLPLEYSVIEYAARDYQMTVGLCVALALIGLELVTFLFGVTMFMPTTSTILNSRCTVCDLDDVAVLCHSSGSVLLSHFLFDAWNCRLYWWVFALCSVLPAAVDLASGAALLLFRRS
ncbi:transmembrane protein 107-like isoform X1 [Bacillus rossius redtenbacheri]|uniref:transmembrane protein 107-like isoform X1 n=1 Tax=Bacillus rossius redtenbacheri TaxID=93214 RepID=UPI002FDCF9B5